jgi:hypothetical protein
MSVEITKGSLDVMDEMAALFNAYRTFYRQPSISKLQRII